jgi:hypothetical protein
VSTNLVEDLGPAFVPSPGAAVETVDVAGEAILIDGRGGQLHLLNSAAALVWSCLDGRATAGEIVADLAGGLGLPPDRVTADVLGLLRGLWGAGMLAGSERPAPDPGDAVDPRFVMEPPNG